MVGVTFVPARAVVQVPAQMTPAQKQAWAREELKGKIGRALDRMAGR